MLVIGHLHCVSKSSHLLTVCNFEISVFSKFVALLESAKFATKFKRRSTPLLMHVATVPWEIKNKFSAGVQENANKWHF